MTDVEERSAFAVLAGLPEALPAHTVLPQLLRRLAAVTGAAEVRLWRQHPSGPAADLRWPVEVPDGGPAVAEQPPPDVTALAERPGIAGFAPVENDDGLLGAITLTLPAGGESLDDEGRRELDDTAICVLSVWQLDERRSALARQENHTDRLAGQLSAATRGLGTVRDLERRRVAAEIIGLSTGPLTELRGRVDALERLVAAGEPPPGPDDARRLLPDLDDLIENFRVMVRGIHPIVLQTRGPKDAVAEAAAGLARPVRVSGSLPRRMEAELGSAVYHFAASALQVLARGSEAVDVHLGHSDGRFEVVVRGTTATAAAGLRASVAVEIDRFSALGGDVEVTVEEAGQTAVATLRGRLPDRLEPPAQPRPGPDGRLADQVRDLALRITARYADGAVDGGAGSRATPAAAAAALALVPRLEGPVRVGIREFGDEHEQLRDLARRTPGVQFQRDPEGDGLMPGGDEPDAVLAPAGSGAPGRVDVRLPGVEGGVLIPAATWETLPNLVNRELLARAGLLRARTVLANATELLRRHPLDGGGGDRLGYQVERLRAQAHELVELEALARLRGGGLGIARTQVRAAERLLGADGAAPHERLALPAAATPEELRAAAIEQMRPWRDIAKHAVNRRQRDTGAAVVRSCERLLAGLTESAGPGAALRSG